MRGYNRTTHGMKYTPEYVSWNAMKGRCLNKNDPAFKNYGGRGIKVCARWKKSFENFFADMGPRPSLDYGIDRINNNGNYEPSNCRWATAKEQSSNKRTTVLLTHNGLTLTMAEWARRLGITRTGLWQRLKTKTVEESLSSGSKRFRGPIPSRL